MATLVTIAVAAATVPVRHWYAAAMYGSPAENGGVVGRAANPEFAAILELAGSTVTSRIGTIRIGTDLAVMQLANHAILQTLAAATPGQGYTAPTLMGLSESALLLIFMFRVVERHLGFNCA